jgi:hypothetical protein
MMNMNTLIKLYFLLVLLNFTPTTVSAAQISASFDRNPVNLAESFQIIFTADDTPDNDPDFTPLDQDFEVLGQSQSSNSSWINGQSSKTIQWTLNVMAKHSGELVVPEIKFGHDASQPTKILVTETAATKVVDTDGDLFLEVEATPESPYVQSQVLYTLRLYRRIEIAQAGLNEPELADAVIEKLGDDSNYKTQINGVDYLVTERKYAIFPQKSGSVTIKPVVLTAEVIGNDHSSFNSIFNSRTTRTKKVSSKSVKLDVKPVPETFTGQHWLSAEQLVLKEEWSGDNQQMKVGEPLTRTLTILAKGTTVGQLPELNSSKSNEKLKTYPDQPVLQEQKKSEGLIAFREEKIAVIPTKAGRYKLPAIEIPWFNSQTQKMEVAIIPEVTIIAAEEVGNQASPMAAVTPPSERSQKNVETPIVQVQRAHIWIYLTIFFGLGWLMTLLYFTLPKLMGGKLSALPRKNELEIDLEDSIKILKKACAENNAVAAKDSLLSWGRKKHGVASLAAVAELSDARLRDEILYLNKVLYGKTSDQWQGKKLFQAFAENKAREKIASTDDDKLEPLYRL